MKAPLAALVRGVSSSFTNALARNPKPLDLARARLQHQAYVKVIEQRVQQVIEIPAAADLADCVFIEDAAVCIGNTVSCNPRYAAHQAGDRVMLTRPGAASRRGEVAELHRTLTSGNFLASARQRLSVVQMQEEGATLDGGDVLLTDRHCFVGLSSRTNVAGLHCLRRLLASQMPGGADSIMGIDVVDDLHLKSLATYAGQAQLAVDDSPGGRHLVSSLEKLCGSAHGYGLHVMPQHSATNVVRLGPCLLVAENCASMPEVQKLAAAAGVDVSGGATAEWCVLGADGMQERVVEYGKVVETPNSEFAKADGALSCRSVILPL